MHWFQKCYFWKNSLSPFRGRWVQEVIFEVAEAKFWISSSFDRFWFRIFVVLGFEVVWPQQPRRPQKGPSEFFQILHFWNQCMKLRKMSYSSALWSKFSINLSTEEGWASCKYFTFDAFWLVWAETAVQLRAYCPEIHILWRKWSKLVRVTTYK